MEKFKLVDGMDYIKEERKRLEGIVATEEYKNNKYIQWMSEWLLKTDDENLKDRYHQECSMCKKHERYLLETAFSFCDEYGCGMKLCKNCVKEIYEESLKEVE